MTTPTRPHWAPATFNDAQDDIDHRPPAESHYLELKSQIMRTESIRKSLSSMSIDGGTIVYGVEEDKQTRVASGINPVRLNGEAERIQQIAHSLDPVLIISEPLTLADPTDPEVGIIVVNVPASPMAPHQADGKYYIRAGTTTEVMSDAQVERLIKARNTTGAPAVELFPAVDGISPSATLSIWVAAVPRPVRDPHLLGGALTGTPNASKWIGERLQAADRALAEQLDGSRLTVDIQEPRLAGRFGHPDLSRRTGSVRLRAERTGWITTIANQSPEPRINLVEIGESASVGLFANYLSTRRTPELPPRNFLWREATGLVYGAALLSNELAASVGYRADIDVALKITGLNGCYPEEPADGLDGLRATTRRADRARITDPEYESQTTWSFAEIDTGSLEPMHRLLGALLRSMGMEDFFQR